MATPTEQTIFALGQGDIFPLGQGDKRNPVLILTNFAASRSVGDLQRRIAVAINQSANWKKITLMVGSVELKEWSRQLDSYKVVNGDTVYFTIPDATLTPSRASPADHASSSSDSSGSGSSHASSSSPVSHTSDAAKGPAPVRITMRNCTTGKKFTLKHIPLDMRVKRMWKKLKPFGVHPDACFFYDEAKMKKDSTLAQCGVVDGSVIGYLEP